MSGGRQDPPRWVPPGLSHLADGARGPETRRGDEETRTRTLTMSAMSGSSGLGSAMSSWMEASTVAMLRDGRQAPCAQRGGGFMTRSSGRRRRPPRSHKPRSPPSRSTHLGRQLEDIQADPPGRVDVGVIDGSQKPDLRRLKWVPWKAADNGDSLLRCCLSALGTNSFLGTPGEDSLREANLSPRTPLHVYDGNLQTTERRNDSI